MNRRVYSRRAFLGTYAGVATAAFAGCLDVLDDEEDDENDEEPNTDPALAINGRYLSSAFPIELVDPDATDLEKHAQGEPLIANYHHHGETSHWHFVPFDVPLEEGVQVRARFLDQDLEEVDLSGREYSISVTTTADTDDGLVEITVDGALIEFVGLETGEGEFDIALHRNEEKVWSPNPLPFVVESTE